MTLQLSAVRDFGCRDGRQGGYYVTAALGGSLRRDSLIPFLYLPLVLPGSDAVAGRDPRDSLPA
jgi:hypothetical protein